MMSKQALFGFFLFSIVGIIFFYFYFFYSWTESGSMVGWIFGIQTGHVFILLHGTLARRWKGRETKISDGDEKHMKRIKAKLRSLTWLC